MNAVSPLAWLQPRPLGADWTSYYGCSSFGALWRAARLNHYHRNELRSILGVTLRSGDDCFRKMTKSSSQQLALRNAYPEAFEDGTHWDVGNWWPYGGPIPWDAMPWRLRSCPACARSCYHSLLFQMPGVHRCPWHHVELIDTCPRCDRDLLAGFREGLPLGHCPCGHDAVDYATTAEGDRTTLAQKRDAIDGYRLWTDASRRVNWLIAPEPWDPRAWDALHALFPQPPDALLQAQHREAIRSPASTFLETIRLERSIRWKSAGLPSNSGLESFNPGIAMLPAGWQPAIMAIGAELLRMIPIRLVQLTSPQSELRQELGRLPAYPCGRFTFLHTESLDRAVLRTLGVLSAGVSCAPRQGSSQASFGQRVKQHPLGKALVERTIQRVLLRGYADGARVVLGRHAPQFYDDPRKRPVSRFAWVLLWMQPGRMPSTQIAWTQQRGTN